MTCKEQLDVLKGLIEIRDNVPKLIYSLCKAFRINDQHILNVETKEIRHDLDCAVEAYKQQIPKHIKFPNLDEKGNIVMKYHCPVCNFNEIEMNQKFCQNCGQALGWGEDVAEEVEDEENGEK